MLGSPFKPAYLGRAGDVVVAMDWHGFHFGRVESVKFQGVILDNGKFFRVGNFRPLVRPMKFPKDDDAS